jgi:hypothetical protein
MYTQCDLETQSTPVKRPHWLATDSKQRTVETVISRLERHLNKCIWTERMLRDPGFAEPGKLESLNVVLANQVTQTRLCKSDADLDFGSEVPLEFAWDCVESLRRLHRDVCGVCFGSFGHTLAERRKPGFEECWCLRIDAPGHKKQVISEYVCSESAGL